MSIKYHDLNVGVTISVSGGNRSPRSDGEAYYDMGADEMTWESSAVEVEE